LAVETIKFVFFRNLLAIRTLMKKVFLSYSFGDDVGPLKQMLSALNVAVLDSQMNMEYGTSLQESIRDAVFQCDFLLFVYSKDNPHIAFEAGIAVASRKPIFSIFSGGQERTFLMDTPYVSALPTEIEKIRFVFELFLENTFPKKEMLPAGNHAIKLPQMYGGGEMVPMKSYFDVKAEYDLISNNSYEGYDRFFVSVFEAYGVNFAKNPNSGGSDSGADFSIWSDALSPMMGNPILIEIKKRIDRRILENLQDQIRKWKTLIGSSIIVFYDRLENVRERDIATFGDILFISIPELVEELESKGFASSIKNIRNRLVHG